jgi:predicted amidohydrolase
MTPPKNLKIGMGQLLVEGAEPKRNLRRAYTMVKDHASQGCDIIVLPECLNLG